MFEVAIQAGRVAELGRLHREQAVKRCAGYSLFLNIHPHEFDYGWLVRPDDPMFRHRWPVTLEITESVPLKYFPVPRRAAEIQRKGVSLAIDDLGAGFSNLVISDPSPRWSSRPRADRRPTQESRQLLLGSIVHLCHGMEAQVVAEGRDGGRADAVIGSCRPRAQATSRRPADPPPDLIWPGTRR
jgi:EAL domain-containing protein (putative c-di-GMP-specific phosphodiesterase class I)